VNWRGWLVFAGLGCVITLACRHDWAAAGGAAGCILLAVVLRFCRECTATRVRFRESAEWGAALAASRPIPVSSTTD
jgi:hypothetical protein